MKRALLLTIGLPATVLLLLAAFCYQTVSTLETTSPTFDEVAHLPAGYAQLVTGKPVFNLEHPPLAKLLAAEAIGTGGGDLDALSPNWRSLDEWKFGRLFLYGPGQDPKWLLNRGRLAIIGLGLLLCLTCFWWSYRLYGPAGGLFTLILCVGSPTLLAHSRLVTTDVPVAAFGVLTAFLVWKQMHRSTVAGALAAGAAFGAALATKFTGVLLLPALGLAITSVLWRKSSELEPAPARVGRGALLMALALAIAVALVALSYGWPPTLSTYLEGIRQVGFNHTPGYEFYLLGEYRSGGFPWYFPMAFLLKTSPAVLLSLGLLPLLPLLRRARVATLVQSAGIDARAFLWLPPLLYGVFIATQAPNIGVRYLIPLYPFFFVALGQLGAALWSAWFGRGALLALVALHAQAASDAHPDPISYFNGLMGCRGPAAIACLDDSNLDWGQDLTRMAEVVNRMRGPGDEVSLLYFGTADPRYYLTHIRSMQDEEVLLPKQQIYAVSLHRLNRLIAKLGRQNDMDWFQRFKPAAVVGNTYYVYDFRAQVSSLEAPHESTAYRTGTPDR